MHDMLAEGPSITQVEVDAVVDMMNNGWYDYNHVEMFQKEFAKYHDRKYCLMTQSCTSAIHLLLAGLGVGPGDEVILPDLTWIATAEPIVYLGATPVFCDVDLNTWCMDVDSLKEKIGPKTKAVIAVDLYSNMPDMKEIQRICEVEQIHLIEDAAEALGSSIWGKKAGSWGAGSAFSFHRTKTITCGEGGALLLDDDDLYERCFALRNHGRDGYSYHSTVIGYKYTPSNFNAALVSAQFSRLDEILTLKRQQAIQYHHLLANQPLKLNDIGADIDDENGALDYSGCWVTSATIDSPVSSFLDRMSKRGYNLRRFFYPLSSLPPFKEYATDPLPNAQRLHDTGFNLPSACVLTLSEIQGVCSNIKDVIWL